LKFTNIKWQCKIKMMNYIKCYDNNDNFNLIFFTHYKYKVYLQLYVIIIPYNDHYM
jgi:hypothetical protein